MYKLSYQARPRRRLARLYWFWFVFAATSVIIVNHWMSPLHGAAPSLLSPPVEPPAAAVASDSAPAPEASSSETPNVESPASDNPSASPSPTPPQTPASKAPATKAQAQQRPKIQLAWDAIYSGKPDPNSYPDMPGVNVISPTWFELSNGSGDISSKADADYVKWAKAHGIKVWALFSNGYEPDRTTQALADDKAREHMIEQLTDDAERYGLQGINIDFENVNTDDKANFVQFVKELAAKLHKLNLTVSIDVTPISDSEMWSLFLDRAALIPHVDYMMLMAYDEHWATSPTAGSVSSIPWTRQAVEQLINQEGIPPSKLILSIPLYTRIWTEMKDADGGTKVSSKAVGMAAVQQLLTDKQLTPSYDEATGQNYVEYDDDGARKRIWLEDDVSIRARMAIVEEYGLAGAAAWNRSFESGDIWEVIQDELSGQKG